MQGAPSALSISSGAIITLLKGPFIFSFISSNNKIGSPILGFKKVCKKLCNENNEIQKSLKNIEPANNES